MLEHGTSTAQSILLARCLLAKRIADIDPCYTGVSDMRCCNMRPWPFTECDT